MAACDGTTAAKRRRERRLRSWWRHERMTVAAALAEALHHSAPKVGAEQHHAPRRQETASAGARPGVLKDPAPQGAVRSVASLPRCRDSGRPHGQVPPQGRTEEEGGGGGEEGMGDGVGEEGRAEAACHRGFGEGARDCGAECGQQEEEEEEAEASPSSFFRSSWWPRSSSPTAVVYSWLVFLVLCRSRCVPFFLAGPVSRHLRHHGRLGPDGQLRGEMSRSSSFFLQWHVQDWCCWVDTPFPSVVACSDARHHARYVPEGLYCAFRCWQWHVQGSFCWYFTPRAVFLLPFLGPYAMHHGRYGPDRQLRGEILADMPVVHDHRCSVVQTAENCGFSAVAVHQGRR